jgi:hypothetical protein
MVTNDATILRLKHDVLYEVAKAAWEGNLDEKREQIPYSMIPGPQAIYRCCIYKERLSGRGSAWQKENVQPGRTHPMWSRSSMRPVRSVPLHPT